MEILPSARLENIVVHNLDKETLIYDLLTDKAYNLNETSAIVYQNCDGKTTFDELKSKHGFTDDLMHFAVDELKANNLIEGETINHFSNLSRREIVKRIGLSTMIALPVISALVAPKAAYAASLTCNCSSPSGSNARPQGCPCSDNSDCCGVCILSSSTCSAITAGSAPTAAACCPR